MPDVTITHPNITIPKQCPVCMRPAATPITLEKTVMRLVHAHYIRQQVAYCPEHADAMHRATRPVRWVRRGGIIAIILGCALLVMWFAVVIMGVRGIVRLLGVALLSGIPSAWLIGHWRRFIAISRDWLIHPAHRATYNALRIASFRLERGQLCAITFRASELAYAVKLAAANKAAIS